MSTQGVDFMKTTVPRSGKKHRTVKERLETFYGKPVEEINEDKTTEEITVDGPVGEEIW